MTWKDRAWRFVDRVVSDHSRVTAGADGLGDGLGLGDGFGIGDWLGIDEGLWLGEAPGDGVGMAAVVGAMDALASVDGAGTGVEPDGTGVLEQAMRANSVASASRVRRT
jgi:hypothetical protein